MCKPQMHHGLRLVFSLTAGTIAFQFIQSTELPTFFKLESAEAFKSAKHANYNFVPTTKPLVVAARS